MMVRIGLSVLGVLHLCWGVPQVLAPKWFFDSFPGLGQRWTAAYPPYNEHLTIDVGAAVMAFGVMLMCAAVLADRRVTTVVLVGMLIFSLLHLVFHTIHHGQLDGADLALSLGSLVLGVLAPAGLLALERRRRLP